MSSPSRGGGGVKRDSEIGFKMKEDRGRSSREIHPREMMKGEGKGRGA